MIPQNALLPCFPLLEICSRCISSITVRVPRSVHHHLPILRLPLPHILHIRMFLRAPRRRQQIHKKRQHIKRKNKRNDPFKHGRDILLVIESRTHEDDGEADFDEDEDQFGPEAEAEDAVLAEVHPQALVFGADEDGADDVAGDEEEEEAVMETGVVQGVEDGEEDEAAGSGNGEDYYGEWLVFCLSEPWGLWTAESYLKVHSVLFRRHPNS